MKQKALTITLMVLLSIAILFTSTPNPQVQGQSPYGLTIFYLTPRGGFEQLQNVTVGQSVTLLASMQTANGSYAVYFNEQLVDSGVSSGYFVSSNFTVPESPVGTYNITLTDVSYGKNTTIALPILTAYAIMPVIAASPSQLQEGTNVVLNVTITGANASAAYGAEITVVQPSPVSAAFNKTIPMTTSSKGTAQTLVTFPDASFSPSGSGTQFAGIYTAYFNRSQSLGQSSFTVGFTDLTRYHRGDTVKINAVGHQPSQSATISIQFNNNVIFSDTSTASGQGIISYSWLVPNEAAIGTYTVTITPQTNPSKAVPDVQTFQVPGYPVTFTAKNLAGEVVGNILLEALDNNSGLYYNSTTFADGTAIINLERGNQTVDAYWNNVKVGESKIAITGNISFTIDCALTNLNVKVQNKDSIAIPFANLNVTYPYTTRDGVSKTGSINGQTDLSGVCTFNSTLPGIVYTVVAYKYDTVFNTTQTDSLPSEPSSLFIVVCPEETIGLKIVDYNNNAIPNARLALIEQASGIFYSLSTDGSGTAQSQVTFGQYRLSIYTGDNVLLNETVINVVSNTQSQVRCVTYNLEVTVKVVDYFSTPIGNVNVQLGRPGMNTQNAATGSDGKAMFNNVIGGDMEVIAYPNGNQNAFVALNLQVTSPTTVTLPMNKYVALGGALVDVSILASIVIIILVAVLLILVELLRRTGSRLRRGKM